MRHAVTALALLAGCVDVTRPVLRRARPAVVRARAEQEAAEAQRRAALPRVPVEQRVTFRSFESEGEVAHDAMGPLRFDRRGMALTPAEDVPAHPIVLARKAARGWVFVTERDEVYVSPTYTGRLRAMRTLGCAAAPPPPSTPPSTDASAAAERAALAAAAEYVRRLEHEPRERRPDASPVLWRSSGRVALSLRGRAFWSDGASLHEVAEPGVVALAWRGEALGARILAHRALELTRDGGQSWRPVPLGEAAPLDLGDTNGWLVATTSRGALHLRDDGSAAPVAPPTSPARWSLCDVAEALVDAARALFARGYERVAAARPECVPWRAEPAWEPPRIVAHLPRDGGPDEMPSWSVPRGRLAPLGTARSRAFLDARAVPAAVSAARPDHPAAGHPITFMWRGGDGRGAFAARVVASAPREIPVSSPWKLVAATRAGLVVSVQALPAGETAAAYPDEGRLRRELFWFGAAGARRLGVALGEWQGASGVALDDGGAVILVEPAGPRPVRDRCTSWRYHAPPGVALALRVDAAGGVTARREVVTGDDFQPLAGLGQRGDRWGVAVGDGAGLTLLPLDGGEVPFGAWTLDGAPTACGAPADDRLHLLDGATDDDHDPLPVTIGPQGDGPDFAQARLVTLERAGGRVCVRRLWGVQHLDDVDDGGEDFGERYAAVRFEARGGELAGVIDDGRRVAELSASLGDRVGFMQDI